MMLCKLYWTEQSSDAYWWNSVWPDIFPAKSGSSDFRSWMLESSIHPFLC